MAKVFDYAQREEKQEYYDGEIELGFEDLNQLMLGNQLLIEVDYECLILRTSDMLNDVLNKRSKKNEENTP